MGVDGQDGLDAATRAFGLRRLRRCLPARRARAASAAPARSKPPDDRGLRGEDRRGPRGEGRSVRRRRRSDPEGAARRVPAARVLPDRSRLQRAGVAQARSTIQTIIEMPTSTGTNRKMRRVGSLEFTLKGQPLKLPAFNEVGDRSRVALRRRSAI